MKIQKQQSSGSEGFTKLTQQLGKKLMQPEGQLRLQ
jgi:hypothetical protein